MSQVDDDDDFELVTNARDLAPPPPLRKEKVKLAEWKKTSGKGSTFLVWELTAGEWAAFMESGRTYKDGRLLRYDTKDEDIRFLAHTIRDPGRNPIWPTVEAAKGQLGHLGKSSLNLLLNAANKVNSGREADSEGNSEETPSGSQPTT